MMTDNENLNKAIKEIENYLGECYMERCECLEYVVSEYFDKNIFILIYEILKWKANNFIYGNERYPILKHVEYFDEYTLRQKKAN